MSRPVRAPRRPSLDEAVATLASIIRPVRPRRRPIEECLGLRLAQPIVVTSPVPRRAIAALDGFTISGGDLQPANPGFLLPLDARPVTAGQPIPDGHDAVVPREHVHMSHGRAVVQRAVRSGEHVVRRGASFSVGEQVVGQGALLGPLGIGLLASLGTRTALVHSAPRVAVVGALPAESPGLVLLDALVRDAGADAVAVEGLPMPAATLGPVLDALARTVDIVVITPGASSSRLEAVLGALGRTASPIVRDPAILPATRTSVWLIRRLPVLVLAGSLPDLAVGFEALGRPALRRLAGDPGPLTPCLPAATRSRIVHRPGRTEFMPVSLGRDDHGVVADPCRWPNEPSLRCAVRSDGLAVLASSAASVPARASICVRPG
jgi:molybdopterin molybdotransferase